MAVTCDEPGLRFFLDRSESGFPLQHVFALAGAAGMSFLLFPAIGILSAFWRAQPDMSKVPPVFLLAGLAFVALWVLGLLSMMLGVLRATRRLERLHVDGVTHELRVLEKGVLGLFGRDTKVATARVAKLAVSIVPEGAKELTFAALQSDSGIIVQLAWWISDRSHPEAKPSGTVAFCVVGVDKREEVLDLALRLAAAAGFSSYRVVRSDQRELEVETDRHTVGDQPMPVLPRADYTRDTVAPEARAGAAQEKLPAFDPHGFLSDYRVREWKPGERVVFHKPFSWGVLGCLPFVAIPVSALVALLAGVGYVQGNRLVLELFLGVFAAVAVFIFAAIVAASLPRRATLDWTTRRITIGREPGIPMSSVTALELRGVKVFHQGSKGNASYWMYRCELELHHTGAARGEPTTTRLVETSSSQDDGTPPWRSALPLVTDLARALGVERRVTDYREKK